MAVAIKPKWFSFRVFSKCFKKAGEVYVIGVFAYSDMVFEEYYFPYFWLAGIISIKISYKTNSESRGVKYKYKLSNTFGLREKLVN